MAKEPGERYANAFDLAHDLDELATGGVTQAASRRGGEWSRFRRAWRSAQLGHAIDYRTRAHLLGWPLVHMHLGRRAPGTRPRTARAWSSCAIAACTDTLASLSALLESSNVF